MGRPRNGTITKSSKKKTVTPVSYSETYKVNAVMLARQMGSLSAAARKVGVSRVSLGNWVKEFAEVKDSNPSVAAIYSKAIEDASTVRQDFLREHYSALSATIKKALLRANDLIDGTNNLASVVNAIEKLSAIITDFAPADGDTGHTQINLLQQTLNQHE